MFFLLVIDTVKSIVFITLKKRFFPKKLLTERKGQCRSIGYARAINNDVQYLNDQIEKLKDFGCNIVFSELVSLNQDNQTQLKNAFQSLSKGDQIVFTKLDRAFNSKSQCINTINRLLNEGIHLRTLSGLSCSPNLKETYSLVIHILYELDKLEKDNLVEKKKEILNRKVMKGMSLGGRPKIDNLKESLVIRLRKEGFSYRSIRSQTGIALSTIRRILLDASI